MSLFSLLFVFGSPSHAKVLPELVSSSLLAQGKASSDREIQRILDRFQAQFPEQWNRLGETKRSSLGVFIEAGNELRIRCDRCSFDESQGALQYDQVLLKLPRGYSTLTLNGTEYACPKRDAPSYDEDLDQFRVMVELRERGYLTIALPEHGERPPTPWLVGYLALWRYGIPTYLQDQAQDRFDELVAMKVIRYEGDLRRLIQAYQPTD